MKREGGLFHKVYAFENLLLAYKKARRGTRKTAEASQFFFHTEQALFELRNTLQVGAYRPGPYRYFEVNDPKRRTIAVAPFRDRVVHHAVVAILEPIFERCFIFDSYATRKNKGVHKAVFQAQNYLRDHEWYLKVDIQKFFDSVQLMKLEQIIERKIKDKPLMALVHLILQNGEQQGKGLPIGNLTSQFFANVYLNPFDHYVKEQLGIPHYVRYMDDFVVFSRDKLFLHKILVQISQFLQAELGLQIKPDSIRLQRSAHGLPFLGLRIFPQVIRFLPANARRMQLKISNKRLEFNAGHCTEKSFLDTMNSYKAHLAVYHTRGLRRQLFHL